MLYKINIISFVFLSSFSYCIAQQNPNQEKADFITHTPILQTGEQPEAIIRKNMFVQVAANKKTVFVGEPFFVTYKLYTTLNRESHIIKEPEFYGCSVLELSADNDPAIETIDGKKYQVLFIRKVQLIPLIEGPLLLGEAMVENIVSFSFDNEPGKTENYTLTLSNKQLIVNVQPLPEKNKPSNFSGVLGNFIISAKIDTNIAAVGEPFHLLVTISGTGNINGIGLPDIKWPHEIEHFDGTDTQQVDRNVFLSTGSKIFDLPFIGKREGAANIPMIEFNFFDPDSKTYKTVLSKNITLTFTKAQSKEVSGQKIVTEDISNRKYLWIVPAIAIIVSIIFIIISKKNKKKALQLQNTIFLKEEMITGETQEKLIPLIKTDFIAVLQELKMVKEDKFFFEKIKTILTKALQEKLLIHSNDELVLIAALADTQKNDQLTSEIKKIFLDCNLALYSPSISEEKNENLHLQLVLVLKGLGLI